MSPSPQTASTQTIPMWMRLAAPLLRLIARALLASCRIERIEGRHYLDQLIAADRSLLLCCWHQRLSACVGYLMRRQTRNGLNPGFLVSPSRDGELIARVVSGMGATIVRGSAHRTGARALRDLYTTMRGGVSPILHPDGPHGPANQAKSGSLLLAQMTRAPLLPMSFSASRYWQLGSWDRLIIPKPFARITLVIGAPIEVARGDDVEARAAVLTEQLGALDDHADSQAGVSPQSGRR